MSDIAMNTPDASQTGGSTTLGNKPDLYHGDRNKLEAWLLQVDRFFHLQGDRIDDENKVVLATTYLRGDAEKWANPIIQRYMDDSIEDAENTALVEDWDAFKIKLRQNFSPFKESVIAEQKIQVLRQTKSAADYTTLFQQYATRIEWDDNALMRMYRQGLKPSVRKELMRTGTSVTNLNELMEEAVRLDNELYELALEERLFTQGTRNQGYTNDRPKKHNHRRTYPNEGRQRSYTPRTPGAYHGYGTEPMHLDNINKGKGPGQYPKEQHKNKKKFSCYNCGKEGHMARDCRSKDSNKVKRQLNVLRRKSGLGDDEEWNVVYRPTLITPEGEEHLLKGFEDITITAPETPDEDTEAEPGSDEEYETPGEEEESSTPKTKYEKMASFKGKHRPATPCLKRQDSELPELSELTPLPLRPTSKNTRDDVRHVEAQINQLHRILGQSEVEYGYRGDTSDALLQMYQDMWHLRSEIDFYQVKTNQPIPAYAHITANIERLKKNLQVQEPVSQDHNPATVPQWAIQAQANWARDNTYQLSQYWHHPNSTQHAKLHWTACETKFCPTHYTAKQEAGRFPERVKGAPRCKWFWFECNNDLCAKHLWEKRDKVHFPGHTNAQDVINMQLTYGNDEDDTRECEQPHWQTCLSDECDKHRIAKGYHGYEQPQTFLGQRHEGRAPPGKSTQ